MVIIKNHHWLRRRLLTNNKKKMKYLIILLIVVNYVMSASLISKLEKQNNFLIKYTITNPTENAIKLLKWGTPLDYQKNVFDIESSTRKKAIYIKYLYKRSKPIARDYLMLEGHSEHSIVIDLKKYYRFTEKNLYVVVLKKSLNSQVVNNLEQVFVYNSHVEKLNEKSKELFNEFKKFLIKKKESPVLQNCQTTSDVNDVKQGVNGAIRESACKKNCLERNRCNRLYSRWFGRMDSERYTIVKSQYQKINRALEEPFGYVIFLQQKIIIFCFKKIGFIVDQIGVLLMFMDMLVLQILQGLYFYVIFILELMKKK